MKYNKFKLTVSTDWAGTEEEYAFIAKDPEVIAEIAEIIAMENFDAHDGTGKILEDLFPDVNEYTDEHYSEVCESDYYSWTIDPFEGDEDEWNAMELIFDQLEEDGFKRWILHTSTSWCGEDLDRSVVTNNVAELDHLFELEAYDRFSDFGGFETILEEMFPDTEDYTDEQRDAAAEVEGDYFTWSVEEYDPNLHHNFDWFEVFLDESIK